MTLSDERLSESALVPFGVTDPLRIPRERYFDRDFYELEKEKLWAHVWQMACRLEEIPDPGDYVEYEICGRSILVVRQHDGSVKAFENACRHRATQLALGTGRFGGGQIVCPFHGWRWNLDGSTSFLYYYEDSAPPECVSEDDLSLRECLAEIWGGCAWINMDRDAPPLADALAPAAAILDGVGVANMRVKYWKEVILNANWKIAQEAFLEGLHLTQTHPQLTFGAGEGWKDRLTYEAMDHGHGQFYGGFSEMPRDYFLDLARLLWLGQDAMTLEREFRLFEGLRNKVPEDQNFPSAALEAYYEYAEGAGIPLPPLENTRIWGGEVSLFPNFLMLPQYANCLSYRIRPYNDDPEWCRFEVWSLFADGELAGPPERPVCHRYEQDDTEHLGQIPRQDFSNIERQQRGLHTQSFDASRLYPENEKLISNMHRELDRYLAR
jgi:nitrite reductase/ring-hydroxylating ferredoxin subunit